MKKYQFNAIIQQNGDMDASYIIFPYDLRAEFGKGRMKVHATLDGVPYDGSIVNMGVKNPDGSICYIIGVLKAIRTKLDKHDGDTIHVVIKEKVKEAPHAEN